MKNGKETALETFTFTADIFEETDKMNGYEEVLTKNELKQYIRIWKQLLKEDRAEVKDEAFDRFSRWIREGTLHYKEPVEKLWLVEFNEAEFIKKKIRIIDEKIAGASDEELDLWIAMRISQMEKNGYSENSDLTFEREYWNNRQVRKYAVRKCITSGEKERSILLLKESREMYLQDHEMTEWCCSQLVKLLAGIDKDRYREELENILITYMPGDIMFFRKLKRSYSRQEWRGVREQLFEKIEHLPGTAAFYAEEGLYNRLVEYLERKGSLEELMEYEQVLGSRYYVSIMRIYEQCLDKMLKQATRRSQYKAVADHVRRVRMHYGGEQWAYRLVERWRQEYSRKTALLKELAKL